MKNARRMTTEGIEQLHQKSIKTLKENETYKHLGILKTEKNQMSRDNVKNDKRVAQ